MFSYQDDIVFDPFCGSGTTCLVAKKNNRKYIGSELDTSFVELANSRLESI
jgi:site-specific DNA-methyltransferase (adenine-specific)